VTTAPAGRHTVAAALFGARLVYAYNWYDIGAVLPGVQAGLHASIAELGFALGAFLVGVAIFQVPAGFAALRWGPARCSVLGLALMGAGCLASAFAPTVLLLALLRFVAGVGAAFFFAPGIALIVDRYPAGERGPVIGLYNGAFSGGGAAGLLLGAWAGAALGWAFALGIGGALLLVTAALLAYVLREPRGGPARHPVGEIWRRGARILRSRSIWALAFGLTGFWAAVYIVAQYLVQYGHDARPEWGTGVTAAVAAAVVVISLPGGPVGGWLGERARDPRVTIALFAGATSALVLLVPFAALPVLVPALLALGFCDGLVFAIQYLLPANFAASRDEGIALGVGFINMVQVVVGGGIVVLFAYLVSGAGYTTAWVVTAMLGLATLPLLLFVERGPSSAPVDAAPGGAGPARAPPP
jgi:MFS family permease